MCITPYLPQRWLSILIMGAVVLTYMPAALAQQQRGREDYYPEPRRGDTVLSRIRPATDAKGMPLGGAWRLYPQLSLAGRFDDNIFAVPSEKESDLIGLVQPELMLQGDAAFGQATIKVYGDFQFYEDNPSEDVEDFGASMQYQSRAERRLNWEASAGYARITQDRSDPEERFALERTELDRYHAHTMVRYDFGHLKAGLGGEVRRLDYRQDFNDDRDRKEYIGLSEFALPYSESTSIYLAPRWRSVRYDETLDRLGLNRSHDEGSLMVGARFDIDGIVLGEIEMGAASLWFKDPIFNDTITVFASANIDWNITRLTTLTLHGERQPYATIQPSSPLRIDNRAEIELNHELRRNIIVSAGAAYIHQKFREIDRKDNVIELTAGLAYYVNQYAHLAVEYAYRKRDADFENFDFSRNRVMIGLKLQI